MAQYEFHISKSCRARYGFAKGLFTLSGNIILADLKAVKSFAEKVNKRRKQENHPLIRPGHLNAMGLIDEILHFVVLKYQKEKNPQGFEKAFDYLKRTFGREKVERTLEKFIETFPPSDVYLGKKSVREYLRAKTGNLSNTLIALEEMLLLNLANTNPAFAPFLEFFDDEPLEKETHYAQIMGSLDEFFKTQPTYGPYRQFLIELLKAPAIAAPNSLTGQLLYIKNNWGLMLSSEFFERLLMRILISLDLIKEEERAAFLGPGPALVPEFKKGTELYHEFYAEEEKFTPDIDWMSNVVMIAKHTYVWLDQLSKKYQMPITKLNEIPDQELDTLADWGFNALWLIGVWERSKPSQKIKQLCGNPEALASAYAIYDYDIALDLGGESAFNDLKARAMARNIRIAVDMVPNHTGIYSKMMAENPNWFIQTEQPPFTDYQFNGPNLSDDPRFGIYIEDGYYKRTNAAVVFKFVEHQANRVRYVYHGNDGTSTPWNDTSQLNFLLPEVREAVLQKILAVARKSPIIRLDAAMTLAKKHYQRLWFPEPGKGGDIPSRIEYAMSKAEFNRLFPKEFWREVVDRVSSEAPHTLLLAEAFWLMEGYFVRSLGMHRVYNSAFMNMLKNEENSNYHLVMKNVMNFNPEILRRFVNFMNNPDELPAIVQFGNNDKYFGVALMMTTMPGLPMFGHGQIEGFTEKYGMEYRQSYWHEKPDSNMIARHQREIFPLLKKRYLFSGVENFVLYDFRDAKGAVNENVFVYSNRRGNEKVLVVYNNKYGEAKGWIKSTKDIPVKKDLISALGLTNQNKHFSIFKDHTSGLQYIRNNEELAGKGLYIELGAYKYHVLMEFREIIDNELGDYDRLAQYLAGQGVFDLEEKRKEIKFAVILEPFKALINADIALKLENYANKRLLMDLIRNLCTAVRDFTGKRQDTTEVLQELDSRLEVIMNELEVITKRPSKALTPALEYLKSCEIKHVKLIMLILSTIQALARTKGRRDYTEDSSWLDEWLFSKVIKETLLKLGNDDHRAQRFVTLVRIFTEVKETLKERKIDEDMIRNLLNNMHTRDFIGLNQFNNTLWYNKESFEELVYWLFVVSVVNALESCRGNRRKISLRIADHYRRVRKLTKLSDRIGYRFENLMMEQRHGLNQKRKSSKNK